MVLIWFLEKAKLFMIVDWKMPIKITVLFLIKFSCLELPSCLHPKCSLFIYTFVLKFVEIPLSHFQFTAVILFYLPNIPLRKLRTVTSINFKLLYLRLQRSNGTCHTWNNLVLIRNLVNMWNSNFIPFWHVFPDSCNTVSFELMLRDNNLALHKIVTHCPPAPLTLAF